MMKYAFLLAAVSLLAFAQNDNPGPNPAPDFKYEFNIYMGTQCDSDYAEFRGNVIEPHAIISDHNPGNLRSVTFDLLAASATLILEGSGPSDIMVITRASFTHGGPGSKIPGYEQCLTTPFSIVAFAFEP